VDGHEGLPVVVFGGRHADLPIPSHMEKGNEVVDEAKVKLMVKAILEARMSAVLDTSQFSKSMARRIVAIFVSELYNLNQDYGVRHVFLEEADEWVPQRMRAGDAWASAAFGAVDRLVRLGGNFLLGCTLISQRSAVINKDVLTQINCLIALRILHKLDKNAVRTWVESVADPESKSTVKFVDSLKSLKNGEAWVWHPESPAIFERVQFRKRETLHATREYFMQSHFEQKDIRMMDVDSFVAKFKAVFEPKPAPVKQIEKPVAPIIEQRRMVSASSKPLSENPFEAAIQKTADERVAPEEIDLTHKQLVVKITHTEKAVSMDTDSQRGQVIYLLGLGEDKTLSMRQIVDEAAEHGWVIPYDTARKSLIPGMVRDGFLVSEGETAGTRYRLPRFVRFDVRKVEA
jgi:hypothetical protein